MLICTPIQETSQNITLKKMKALKGRVDLAEIWLDRIRDLDIKTLLKKTSLPVVCVCKKPEEKGYFKGTYAEMADILIEAAKGGAAYIDISLQGIRKQNSGLSQLIKKIHHESQIIISYHDFKKTPSLKSMLAKAVKMKKSGADIVKIAVMAKSHEDCFSVIALAQLLKEKGIPHILIAMGKKGVLSRVLTPFLGGTIMFAPLSAKEATASGQLTVRELKHAWSLIRQ